jgi:hypothetical protein
MLIDYDGRRFSPVTDEPGARPVAHYRQVGDLVWGEFAGGGVRHGSLTGTCAPDGEISFAYCMTRAGGEVIAGRCRSVPQLLPDGRVRLTEYWERFTPVRSSGVSALEELPARLPRAESPT